MKLINIEYKKFTFPIKKTIENSKQTFQQKDVIIIKAFDSEGNKHFSEVSPLPNFSNESIEDCERVLNDFITIKIKFPIELNEIKKHIILFEEIPSLKFAFEQLILNNEIVRNKKLFEKQIHQNRIPINGLLDLKAEDETLTSLNDLLEEGFKTIKVKIGINNFKIEFKIIERIFQKFDNKIKLRLDVNGKWTYKEAKENLEHLSKFNIELLEQPVTDNEELKKLAETSIIKLAPDESIQTYEDAIEFINNKNFSFIILKPTIKLGIFDAMKIIKLAKEKNKIVIITSAFETAIGRSTLLYLASLTKHKYAHGLGLELLGEDVISNPFKIEKPNVLFDLKDFPLKFNLDF